MTNLSFDDDAGHLRNRKWSRPLIGLPPGTVLADSIKLTLKVARG